MLFKSIGITFSIIIFIVLTVATMYLSYIIGIGLLLVGLTYIIYSVLQILGGSNEQTKHTY